MTIFGIHFMNPAALGLLGLSVPLILLYLLKMKRVPKVISSNLLWTKVVNDLQATHPFQKLQRNLLLILQLLALFLLAGALARPTAAGTLTEGTSIVLIVDTSASMKAMDGAEEVGEMSRLQKAKEYGEKVVDQIATAKEGMEIMLVEAGGTTRIRQGFTSDRGALHTALDALKPSDRSATVTDSLRLAAATLKTRARPEIVLISDGAGVDLSPLSGLPATRFLQVGRGNDNVAVTLFDVRPATPRKLQEMRDEGKLKEGFSPYSVFAGIRNFGKKPRKAYVTLYFEEELIAAEQPNIPAESEISIVFERNLPPGVLRIEVEADDLLAADNVARAVARPVSEIRVAVVGPGNPFLERVLLSFPYVDARSVRSEDLLSEGPWDLVILDR
ncbi:MAG: vWA domain-containing protein, partial [Planctomycetota bacterium]